MIGGAPYADVAQLQLPVNAKGRLESPEAFNDIIIRTSTQGQVTRLRDVASVELGASEYALRSLLNNKDAVAIPIFAAPGANALNISRAGGASGPVMVRR
jgi:multidrug efflux pump